MEYIFFGLFLLVVCYLDNLCTTLSRSAVTPMAVTSPPALISLVDPTTIVEKKCIPGSLDGQGVRSISTGIEADYIVASLQRRDRMTVFEFLQSDIQGPVSDVDTSDEPDHLALFLRFRLDGFHFGIEFW